MRMCIVYYTDRSAAGLTGGTEDYIHATLLCVGFFLDSRSPDARRVPASPLRLAICTSRSSGNDVKCSGQLRSATQLLRLPPTSTKTR